MGGQRDGRRGEGREMNLGEGWAREEGDVDGREMGRGEEGSRILEESWEDVGKRAGERTGEEEGERRRGKRRGGRWRGG